MNSNSRYSPKIPNLGQNRLIVALCDLEMWRMALKNNNAHFYATSSFVNHFVAIGEFKLELQPVNTQIGGKFVLTSMTLTFDLWPWPVAWTSLLSLVITHGRTDWTIHRDAWSQLKGCCLFLRYWRMWWRGSTSSDVGNFIVTSTTRWVDGTPTSEVTPVSIW